jgi:hypothetical protein
LALARGEQLGRHLPVLASGATKKKKNGINSWTYWKMMKYKGYASPRK